MAICGIATVDELQSPATPCVKEMLVAMVGGSLESGSYCGVAGAALGAGSKLETVSRDSSDRLLIVCDAEISNHRELWQNFSAVPPPATNAALIAALYKRHGVAFLRQLRGAFSFALWDKRDRKLLLARDSFGIKSLCYAETPASFLFASQPRGIFASRQIEKRENFRALVDYLNYSVVPAPQTSYEGIFKLKPGEYLVWQHGKVHTTRYWDMQYTEEEPGTVPQLAAELFSRMEQAVRDSSADLNPEQLGCFLSGGTDSSTLAGLLSRIKNYSPAVFSIGFAETRFNELNYAHAASKHFGLRHFERIVGPQDAYDLIPKIVKLYDEPFGNASAIPTYACLELAKSHGISVMLAGDGGDELFGGNERYRTHQVYELYQRVPRAIRKFFEPALFAVPFRSGVLKKVQGYVRRSNVPNPERYCEWRLLQVFPPREVLGHLMPSVNGDLLSPVRAYHRDASAHSELNRLMHVDINMTLGDEDLPKVARTAEGVGIGVRFPYLDSSLAEFSGRIPVHLKVRGLQKRYLFKRATKEFLPRDILKKKKHGFGLPIGIWLKTDPKLRAMVHDVLLSPRAYQRGYFQRTFIEHLMKNLETDNTTYFGDLLWIFLMLELWHRTHMEGSPS